MAIVELRANGRPPIAIGGASYTAITASLISLPNGDKASLQVTAVRHEAPTHPSWPLMLPDGGEQLLFRWKREGECTLPGAEWLLDRTRVGRRSTSQVSVRAGRFACTIRLPDGEEYTFGVSGSFTFQLTLEQHFAYQSPRLRIGCTDGAELQSESWFERFVPFDEDVAILIEGL